jgi:hypothetical protein
MTDRPQETLEHMEAMLRRCRRRIVRAEVSVRIRANLQLFMTCLLGLAAVFLVLRILALVFGTPAPGGVHVVATTAILAAVIFGRAALQGILSKPVHMKQAAERLDLSQETHNRIATAIALLRSGDDSKFARAAIRDGFEHLQRLQSEEPHVDPSTTSWRRKGSFLVASVAMVLAGLFLTPGPPPVSAGDPAPPETSPVAFLDQPHDPFAPDTAIQPSERVVSRGERQARDNTPIHEDDDAHGNRGNRPEPGTESRSEGPVGQHASGKSRSSQSATDSRSAASGSGVKSEPGETEPGKPRMQRDAKRQTAGNTRIDRKNEKGGSINARGSSGTGSMRTAQNEWSSRVKAKADDSDDFEQLDEPDEEMDPDKQRMGVQPALKNRTSRVSRELSLSMGTGLSKDMMKGRGGPSAQKKSRGTATMIMGVPVPGFVRGRLLPGPTKSTQEEVEPSPREGEHATVSDLHQALPEEDPQERFRPAADIGERARDYLIDYHAEHENRRNEAKPGE